MGYNHPMPAPRGIYYPVAGRRPDGQTNVQGMRCQVTHESPAGGYCCCSRCEEGRNPDGQKGQGRHPAATSANVVQQYHSAPALLEQLQPNHLSAPPPYTMHYVPFPSPPHYATPPYAYESMPPSPPAFPNAHTAPMYQSHYPGDSVDVCSYCEPYPHSSIGQPLASPPTCNSWPSNQVQTYGPHAQHTLHNTQPMCNRGQQIAQRVQAHEHCRPSPNTVYQGSKPPRFQTTARASDQMERQVDAVIARVTQAAPTSPRSSHLPVKPGIGLEPGMERPAANEPKNVLYRNASALNAPGVLVSNNGIAPRITVPTVPVNIAPRITVPSKAYTDDTNSPVGPTTSAPKSKHVLTRTPKHPSSSSVRTNVPAPTKVQADTRGQSILEKFESIWAYPSPNLHVPASLSSSPSPTALLSPIDTLASKEITMIMKERQRRGGVAGTNASARQASVPLRSITPAIGPFRALIASDAGSQKGSSAVTTTKPNTSAANRAGTHASVSPTNDGETSLIIDNTVSESSGEQSTGATNGLSTSFLATMAPKFNVHKHSPTTPSPLNPRSAYWLYVALLDTVVTVAKPVPGWQLAKPVRPKSALVSRTAQKKSSMSRLDRLMWYKFYNQKRLSTCSELIR